MIRRHEAEIMTKNCIPATHRMRKKSTNYGYKNVKDIKFRCNSGTTQSDVMLARGWTKVDACGKDGNENWHLWWCETNEVRLALDMKLSDHQKLPHFPNHYELTRKNYLCRNLKRYKKMLMGKPAEAELCDCMPITFELPNEYHMLVEEYHKQGGTWIVKPVTGSQGKGIFLFQKLKHLTEFKNRELHQPGPFGNTSKTFIVQKYIDSPLLLAGRKFDLRIYVLVTSFNPLKVWLAREGFARLSGVQFSLDKLNDNRIHLTNMAIQLKVTDIEGSKGLMENQNERGYKWALCKVREYLTAKYGIKVMDKLLLRISGIIMASLQAVKPVIINSKNSFELYGYDILLDENLKPWLLEVNASPSLSPTDAEDSRLKSELISDLLKIIDFEGTLNGNETRVGGFDLLWNDGPVWTCFNAKSCDAGNTSQCFTPKKLNIFLGSRNDRAKKP